MGNTAAGIWNTRAVGTLGEPNWLGSLLMVPFIASTASIGKKMYQRIWYTTCALAFFLGILLTQSRSSIIASFIGVILLFFLMKKVPSTFFLFVTSTILVFFSSIWLFAGWYASQSIVWINRLPIADIRGIAGTDSRIWIYQKGFQLFLQKPMGWGWEQIRFAYSQHILNTYPGIENVFILRSHNLLLDTLLTGGVIGALLSQKTKLS